MPHNAGLCTRCQFFTDNHGRKKLLVTHDVLFVAALDLTVLLFFDMQVSDAVLEQKEQTLRAHHRSKHAVRGRVDIEIRLVFRILFQDRNIEIHQDSLFEIRRNRQIRIIGVERCNCSTLWVLFPKAIETRLAFCCRAIEHAFNRDNAALGIVLHVVGENHQLRDVDKTAELFLREPFIIHPLAFGHHAAYVVRLLDLDKNKRESVDEQRNVGAETFIAVLASEFRRAMVRVVFRVFKIDQAKRRIVGQTLVELLAQIVVIQFLQNVRKHALRRNSRSRIQLLELLRKNVHKDVRLWVVGNRRRCARCTLRSCRYRNCAGLRNFSQIRIADASQMLNRSQLNARRFRKKTWHKNNIACVYKTLFVNISFYAVNKVTRQKKLLHFEGIKKIQSYLLTNSAQKCSFR